MEADNAAWRERAMRRPGGCAAGKDPLNHSFRVREVDMAIDIKNLVETIVIVMLENRSFDHMLGYLSLEDETNRTDIDGIADPTNPVISYFPLVADIAS
jgi:phospholipase C